MADPLRHRQTKGAATDMVDLTPPRHIPTLPEPRGSIRGSANGRNRRPAVDGRRWAYGRMGEDAPHLPLPRTGWGASGGKRTAIHSECGCYSMTSSARARIDGGMVS